jgi:signal transduction histidine kinase
VRFRHRLVLLAVFATVFPTLVASVAGDYAQRQQLKSDQMRWVAAIGESSSRQLTQWLTEQKSTLSALLLSDELRESLAGDGCVLDDTRNSSAAEVVERDEKLKHLLMLCDQSSVWFNEIRVCDPEGKCLISTVAGVTSGSLLPPEAEFSPNSAQLWPRNVSSTNPGTLIWSSRVFRGMVDPLRPEKAEPSMFLVAAIRPTAGTLKGFLVCRLALDQLPNLLLPPNNGSSITLVVEAPPGQALVAPAVAPLPNDISSVQVSRGTPFRVVSSVPYSTLDGPIQQRHRRVAFILLSTTVFSALVAYWLAQKAIQPLDRLENAARRLAEGERGIQVGLDQKDEIGELGRTFDLMSCKLDSAMTLLQASKEEAIEAYQQRSKFFALMTHELRTPLSAIIGYSEMLLDQVPDLNLTPSDQEAWKEDLSVIRKSGRQLLEQINNVLDFSKSEAGKLENQYELFDADDLLTEVRLLLQHLVQPGVGFRCSAQKPGTGPLMIHQDRQKLKQILVNLIGNAAKFTKAGHIECRLQVTSENQLQLEVEDTGPGIPADQIANIFSEFTQVKNDRPISPGGPNGTGLGLAVVERFCQSLGGRVEVVSPPLDQERGCLFVVSLPL